MTNRAFPLSQWITSLRARFTARRDSHDASLELANTLDWLARLRTP